MAKVDSSKAISRELRSLEKRIERAEKKISDLKEFKRSIQALYPKSNE